MILREKKKHFERIDFREGIADFMEKPQMRESLFSIVVYVAMFLPIA